MEITHTWVIRKLIQKNDNTGTVSQVYFKVYSTDTEYSYIAAGNIELDTDDILNFIPYDDLTEELVLGWVYDKLGPDLGGYEQTNTYFIDNMRNPPVPPTKVEPLPWESPQTP